MPTPVLNNPTPTTSAHLVDLKAEILMMAPPPPAGLVSAVDRLAFADDIKLNLIKFLRFEPVGGGYQNITEALIRREIVRDDLPEFLPTKDINSGATARNALRVLLWALVYYPGQSVIDHIFLTWKEGDLVTAKSERAQTFRRNEGKRIQALLDNLKTRNLGLVFTTIRDRTTENVGARGFRLTRSAEEYLRVIRPRAERRAANGLEKYVAAMGDEKIVASDVAHDETLVESVNHAKKTIEKIGSSKITQLLIPKAPTPRLVAGKK